MKNEFCEEEISKRRYLLEHREIIKTEVLFPNILEVNIPSKVYVGIIGVDRDDIITQSWSTPNKLRKSASMGKVLSKAFELLKITYCRDWFTFEDKILSFRPLDNRDEPLNKLVEIGTVEEYSVNEFVNVSFKYEEALLHLINRSIEELASYKNIQWLPKEKYFRFKPIGVPRERKITWKNKKWQRVLLLLKFGIAKRSKFYILGNSHLKFNLLDQMKMVYKYNSRMEFYL